MLKNKKKRSVLGSTGTVSRGFSKENDGMLGKEKTSINTNIHVIYLSPTELKPNSLNSEYFNPLSPNEYEALKRDIEERGMQDPLLIKKDKTLLTGENRLRVALDLNLPEIPVVYKRVSTENEELDFILNDNILRRQLSPEEKKRIIQKRYGDEIFDYQKGGDRSSKKAKKNSKPFIEKVSEETGIPLGTTQRLVTEIRKEKKEQHISKPAFLLDKVKKQIKVIEKMIDRLSPEERKKSSILLEQLSIRVKEF